MWVCICVKKCKRSDLDGCQSVRRVAERVKDVDVHIQRLKKGFGNVFSAATDSCLTVSLRCYCCITVCLCLISTRTWLEI